MAGTITSAPSTVFCRVVQQLRNDVTEIIGKANSVVSDGMPSSVDRVLNVSPAAQRECLAHVIPEISAIGSEDLLPVSPSDCMHHPSQGGAGNTILKRYSAALAGQVPS